MAQDPSSIITWAKLLKTVNDVGLSLLSDSKDLTILSYPCHWTRKAGWYRWQLNYDGKIACSTIGKEYTHEHCKSKGCAWKEPFMVLVKDFIVNNRAPKSGLVDAINASDLSPQEKQDLLKLAGAR